MITLLTTVLVSPAVAQERTTTTPKTSVDPEYLLYLDSLQRIRELDVARDPDTPVQLFPGVVVVTSFDATPIGTAFTTGQMPHMKETWITVAPMQVGVPFRMEHVADTWTYGQEADHLQYNNDIMGSPCYEMQVDYVQLPDATFTAELTYDNEGITRSHYLLSQDGWIVGRMFREHHLVQNAEEAYFDHWAFFSNYLAPGNGGSRVQVHPYNPVDKFETTADFFADLDYDANWKGFAQIQYFPSTGSACLGGGQGGIAPP